MDELSVYYAKRAAEYEQIYARPDRRRGVELLGATLPGLFAGFWWSHVPLERLDAFLRGAVAAVAPGALLVFADNLYIEGSSTPASRTDAPGNSYQTRSLNDGSRHEVLKNFPAEPELRARVAPHGANFRYQALDCYWLMSFTA